MTHPSIPSTANEIRSHATREWRAATGHRLFREIIADVVDDDVFERYLRIEFGFIDTAAAALGAAIARAPRMDDRVVLAAGLHDLLTRQVGFFLDTLGSDATALIPPGALGLHLHFDTITRTGDYADLLATMLAAEWLYETWCEPTRASPSERQAIRAWTELHTEPAFTKHAAWLRNSIEALEPVATSAPARRARLGVTFRRALEAEIRFHDAAYDD